MKHHHLGELHGLRLYYLGLSYESGIKSVGLKTLRMVWLNLKSSTPHMGNFVINREILDEDIVEMVNGNPELTRLELAYFNSKCFAGIANKSQLTLLKVTLLEIELTFDWRLF